MSTIPRTAAKLAHWTRIKFISCWLLDWMLEIHSDISPTFPIFYGVKTAKFGNAWKYLENQPIYFLKFIGM